MRVTVSHGIDDLQRDMRRIAVRSRADMVGVVREGIRVGRTVARDNAKRTAGAHGKHYPRAITDEMKLYGALGVIAGEYGPDPDLPQGDMSFEDGSRNQPAHNDIAKSYDLVAPAYRGEVGRLPEKWFW